MLLPVPGYIIILFLNPLAILIGFDLLEHRLFILTEEDTETRVLQPNRMHAHMRKVIEVLLLLESQGGVIGENGRVTETAMGDVVKYERGRGEETSLDIMEGGRMLVIFREFLEKVHRGR